MQQLPTLKVLSETVTASLENLPIILTQNNYREQQEKIISCKEKKKHIKSGLFVYF